MRVPLTFFSIFILAAAFFAALPLQAQEDISSDNTQEAQQAAMPDQQAAEDKLQELFSQIAQEPDNLDLNFAYATLATRLGKYDEALASYERMLIINPELHRVKLDMAVVYMHLANYGEARVLFEDVLSADPPESVKNNIDKMLAQIGSAEKRHRFSGAFTAGYNSDSNASASPGSGAVDVLGFSIPLNNGAGADSDDHLFGALSLAHKYIIPGRNRHSWGTEGLVYRSRQSSLSNIDVRVYSVKTGPTFNMPGIRSKFGFDFSFTDTQLANEEYQKTLTYSLHGEHVLTSRVLLKAQIDRESRRFNNTATTTVYELKNGRANQQKLNMLVAVTPKDLLNFGLIFRQEDTRVTYNDNRQSSFSANYTKVLAHDYFLTATLNWKKTHYKGIDVLVNPSTIRRDLERSYAITLGKKFTDSLVGTIGYKYTDVGSTLQNYAYENERISAALTWQF